MNLDEIRKSWDESAQVIKERINDFESEINASTGDEPYYWELIEIRDELVRKIENLQLSKLSDKELKNLLKSRGYL